MTPRDLLNRALGLLRQVPGARAPLRVLARNAIEIGEPALAYLIAADLPDEAEAFAFEVGWLRYGQEGIGWVEAAPAELPVDPQICGALSAAAGRGAVEDMAALRLRVSPALRREVLQDDFGEVAAEHLDAAAGLAAADVVAPSALLKQLARAGRAEVALALADAFVAQVLEPLARREPDHRWAAWPYPIHAVILGLAERGAYEEALALTDRLASTGRKAEAVADVADLCFAAEGPVGVEGFLDGIGKRDPAHARILGAAAQARGRRGDRALLDAVANEKGMARFRVQTQGFWGFLEGDHLDLAEAMADLADGSQAGHQRGCVGEKRAAAGDVERSLDIVRALRGQDKAIALTKVIDALSARQPPIDLEEIATTHRWARAEISARLEPRRSSATRAPSGLPAGFQVPDKAGPLREAAALQGEARRLAGR